MKTEIEALSHIDFQYDFYNPKETLAVGGADQDIIRFEKILNSLLKFLRT